MPKNVKILIAEPERAIRESIEMILADEGYHCITSRNFDAMLKDIYLNTFDIIIADINLLSDNLDELNKAIHAHTSPPVILITLSYEQIRDLLPLMKFGINEYLLKPFLFDDLLERIERIIELRSHAQNTPSS